MFGGCGALTPFDTAGGSVSAISVSGVLAPGDPLTAVLPPDAVGRDYLGNGDFLALDEDGRDLHLSLAGLAGVSLGARSGIEVNFLGLVAGLAVTGFLGQLAITEAFRHGQASVVAPFEYTALAWGMGLDWVLWQAVPGVSTLLGGAIIIGSGLYLVRQERTQAVVPP